MSESRPRSPAAIDADLRALCTSRGDAQRELAAVRRRLSELTDFEAKLVVAIDGRARRIDDVLDERLRVLHEAGEDLQPRPPVERPALAGTR